MNKLFLFFGLIVGLLTSCLKKTECSGTVYSKYHAPVSNVEVTLVDYKSSKDLSTKNIAKTDANGFYEFSFRTKRNHTYAINCKCDSGFANAQYLSSTKSNNINLFLNK